MYPVCSRELPNISLKAVAEDCCTAAMTGDILQRNICMQEVLSPVTSSSLSIIPPVSSLPSRVDLISSPRVVDRVTASCNAKYENIG